MSEWLAIRWCVGFLLGLLAVLCIAGHVSSIVRIVSRGESISVIPFIGGVAGAFAVLIVPIPGIRGWFWVPLLIDFCIFAAIVAILSHRKARRTGAGKPGDEGTG